MLSWRKRDTFWTFQSPTERNLYNDCQLVSSPCGTLYLALLTMSERKHFLGGENTDPQRYKFEENKHTSFAELFAGKFFRFEGYLEE